MSDIDITTAEGRAELRKLAETATPGPWHWDDHRVPTLYGRGGELGVYVWEAEVLEASHNGECGCRASCTLELEVAPSDAELIAAAVNALPALLDALDAAEARPALPDPKGGCVCIWHTQNARCGYTERLLEYVPACPEHSEHLYDPRTGTWIWKSGARPDRVDELAQVFHAAEHEVAHYGGYPWGRESERTREAYRSGIRAVLAKLEETR